MLKRSRHLDTNHLTQKENEEEEEDPLIELDKDDEEEASEMSALYEEDPSQVVDLKAVEQIGKEKIKCLERDRLNIHHDPGSDSSEDERPNRNTVGDIPLKWYQHEEHIGYDKEGKKIEKSHQKDRIDRLIEKMDNDGLIRTLHDRYNDEEVELTRENLRMLLNIKKGKFPDRNVEPYMEYIPWFSSKVRIHPLKNTLRKKSSFVPSRHEERKVAELVQAIKTGKLKKTNRQHEDPDTPRMIWAEDGRYEREGSRLAYLQPPKKPLPGHEESFNPPEEYLPTKAERKRIEERNELYKEDEYPKFIPQGYESLRHVPGHERYAREVFERCLDLFMCPRTKSKKKHEIQDQKEFFPDLPKPQDLQPFPTSLFLKYCGHQGKVRTISVDPMGQWLASGGDDGQLRIWEISTTRCLLMKDFETPISHIEWHPNHTIVLLALGKRAVLFPVLENDVTSKMRSLLKIKKMDSREETNVLTEWKQRDDGGIDIEHGWLVTFACWHCQGDYFATIQPGAGSKAVLVHRLLHKASQSPFKKSHGRMVQVAFHPKQPHFIVMAKEKLRIYDLSKQQLCKKLIPKFKGAMTRFDIHPGGENVLVGGEDNRLSWYDLELSVKPYKTLKFHHHAIRGVHFHPTYPLFASASDDCSLQVFHGMVYDDLDKNALIVPVKILKGHTFTDSSGILDCKFHPNQPWIFTAGADGNIHLYCN